MEPPAKKRRGLWSLEQLKAAMAAVQGRLMSQRAAAARYSIPRRTLVNHLKTGKVEKQIGRRTILTAEQENDLASRIKRLAAVGFPLTPKVIRHQAYIFCERHEISNNFNQNTKRAGKDWLKLFLKRHPDISKRKVQILNPGRAQKLNKPIVMQHFEEYKKIYEELEIGDHPERLYNMDEKGCRLTIHNQPMVLAQKGAKRVHMVAPEHAENVTVAACVNALGSPIPPMVIFKGVRLKPEFKDNLPAGSLVKMAPKGSMTSSLFIEFIHHFGKYKAASKCLLVFDGASCHLDYHIVEAAHEEDIVLYCLPSNTTHELQPLDKSVNKSFEHHWDEEALLFLYQHPDKKLTKARFNSIFSRVWSKCMTHQNIVNGFRATGLYPYNPDAIPVEAYAPSALTERPLEQESDATRNDRSLQMSPTPGPSGINLRRAVKRASVSSSDSNETFLEDQNSRSPSLLSRDEFSLDTIAVEACIPSALTERHLEQEYDATGNDLSLQMFPTPDPSGINLRRAVQKASAAYSFDSNKTLFKDQNPLVSTSTGIKRRLVDYSSSNSDSAKSNVPAESRTSDIVIRRPIIYSSESDSSTEEFIPRQTFQRQFNNNIYSSSDDENTDPLSKQERTPIKQINTSFDNIKLIRQKRNDSTTSDDSEDNVPLERLKATKNVKSPFQQLIPTPNFAVVKQKKPRRKAINYKARIVTKDLFTDIDKRKQVNKKQQQSKRNENKKNEKPIIQRKNTRSKTIKGKKKETRKIDPDDKWYCHACNTESFEDMRQCPVCQRWFHEQCLGLTKEDVDFECLICD